MVTINCVVRVLLLRRQEDRKYFNCMRRFPPNYLSQNCSRYTRYLEKNLSCLFCLVILRLTSTNNSATIFSLLWIRIGFSADTDLAFYLSRDPDPGIQNNAVPDPGHLKAR
jgi:hypothetical protein